MLEPVLPVKDGYVAEFKPRQGPMLHLTLADRTGMVWLRPADVCAMRRVSHLDPTNGVKHWTRIYLASGSTWEVTEEPSAVINAMKEK